MSKIEFLNSTYNCILDGSDSELMGFAKEELGYKRDKGLDFVAKFNNKYIIGEAKFLTDFGGHQNAQFNDAIDTLKEQKVNATRIAILDGVIYIPTNNKMFKFLKENKQQYNILSSLVLRDFLFQI